MSTPAHHPANTWLPCVPCSCFCKLLERLHLLDALWKASNPGPTPGMQAEEPQQQPGGTEIEPDADQVSGWVVVSCRLRSFRAAQSCDSHPPHAVGRLLMEHCYSIQTLKQAAH